jgi:hypothetical protein
MSIDVKLNVIFVQTKKLSLLFQEPGKEMELTVTLWQGVETLHSLA